MHLSALWSDSGVGSTRWGQPIGVGITPCKFDLRMTLLVQGPLYPEPMLERLRANRREVILAGVISALGLAEALTANVHGHRLAAVFGVSCMTVSLVWRVRWPFVPAVVATIAATAMTAVGVPLNSTIAVTVALVLAGYSAGAHLPTAPAAAALAVLLLGAGVSVVLDNRSVVSNLPFAWLLCAAPWGVGLATRNRHRYTRSVESERDTARLVAEEAARRVEAEKAAAIAAERARIARELHDVVTHTLSVIGLQAGGVRRLLREDQERERQALMVVEDASRQAHADMRRLLHLLREDQQDGLSPQPGLADLPSLCTTADSAGLQVEYAGLPEGGDHAIPPGVELAAYRIVQEALTNVRRHTDASRAVVRVERGPGCLSVEIVDNGSCTPADSGSGNATLGFGLIGMQERVDLYAGTLIAGYRPEGGFRVAATIPLGTPA